LARSEVYKCGKMENRQQILAELSGISPFMAEMELKNPFTIPAGYFDILAAAIMEKIQMGDVLMPSLVNTNAYQVPLGYFEGLPGDIISKIKQATASANEVRAELEEIAPLLNTVSRQEVYSVPVGYFGQTNFISSALPEKKTATIVHMKKARRWMQYAAAALVAGVLVTGAFLYTDTNSYVGYEKYDHLDVPSELNKVSEDELVTYLNNPEHFVVTAPESTITANEDALSDVKNNLQQLSDEELDQYLKENTEPAEVTAPAKNS